MAVVVVWCGGGCVCECVRACLRVCVFVSVWLCVCYNAPPGTARQCLQVCGHFVLLQQLAREDCIFNERLVSVVSYPLPTYQAPYSDRNGIFPQFMWSTTPFRVRYNRCEYLSQAWGP